MANNNFQVKSYVKQKLFNKYTYFHHTTASRRHLWMAKALTIWSSMWSQPETSPLTNIIITLCKSALLLCAGTLKLGFGFLLKVHGREPNKFPAGNPTSSRQETQQIPGREPNKLGSELQDGDP
jgi:hypothetical protein